MTCSWCNKKISFIRALSDSQYCSDEHRKAEREQCRQLAIQRLRNSPAFQSAARAQSDPHAAASPSQSAEFEPASA